MAAGRALSARGGLPIYAGLGALAATDVIAWPAAVAAGVGYAVLRWWGPFGHQVRPPAGPAGRPRSAPPGQENPAAPPRARATATGRTTRAGAGPARTRKAGGGPRPRP